MTQGRADYIRYRLAEIRRSTAVCDVEPTDAIAVEYRALMREWWTSPRPAWYLPRQEPKARFRIRGTKIERVIMRLQGHSHE